MIYKVNTYNEFPTYFVDQKTFDENPDYKKGTLIVGSKQDAEALLLQRQQDILSYEAVRFSICATFVDGNNTTWREIQESDPEDTICQVFDTFTGTYTECPNKTEAYSLNEQKKQLFLSSIGLSEIIEIDSLPPVLAQPTSFGTQSL